MATVDISAGLRPRSKSHPPTHPAGRVTAFDEETGLPIVKRHTRVERTPHSVSVERETVEKAPAKHAETGRDILHGSKDRATLVNLAKKHASSLESGLKEVAKSVPGAHFDAVRSEKTPERLTEKIEKENQPVETIPDILAGRIKVDTPEAHRRAANAIQQHFDVVRDRDEFDKGDEQTGYRVHKLQVRMSPELSAEVHIVPKEIAAVNDQQHDAYDKMREAALEAKELNDGAMEKFEDRNGENGGKVEAEKSDAEKSSPEGSQTSLAPSDSDRGGAESSGTSSNGMSSAGNGSRSVASRDSGPSQRDSGTQPNGNAGTLKVGDHVTLPDGRSATVAYVPGKNSQIPTYRFTTSDGKTVNLRAKQVENGVKPADKGGYVAVDFDGTLAKQMLDKSKLGPPVPKMLERVKRMLKNGEDVRILTAKIDGANGPEMKKKIEDWCRKYIGQVLPVTNRKDEHVKAIFDDRAVQVARNDGTILGSHRKARGDV